MALRLGPPRCGKWRQSLFRERKSPPASLRQPAVVGDSTASRIRSARAANSSGSGRGSWADGPITTAGCRSGYRRSTFSGYDRDGLGINWPISYDDISPYYDKAEKFIGVTGTVEGLPTAPDGIFQKAPTPKAHEHMIRAAGKKLGIPFIANRRAIITSQSQRPGPAATTAANAAAVV